MFKDLKTKKIGEVAAKDKDQKSYTKEGIDYTKEGMTHVDTKERSTKKKRLDHVTIASTSEAHHF